MTGACTGLVLVYARLGEKHARRSAAYRYCDLSRPAGADRPRPVARRRALAEIGAYLRETDAGGQNKAVKSIAGVAHECGGHALRGDEVDVAEEVPERIADAGGHEGGEEHAQTRMAAEGLEEGRDEEEIDEQPGVSW